MEMENLKTSRFIEWKPDKKDLICEQDGKLIVCHFEKVFGHDEKLSIYDRFLIGRDSYVKQLDQIIRYINFFMSEYDTDNELVTAYLKIKFAVDKENAFDAEDLMSYKAFLYDILFTNSMIDKINYMVEENYLDDIEVSEDDKKYSKDTKKYLESLEFTNNHIQILLKISIAIKIMVPVLFHFIQKNKLKSNEEDFLYNFYDELFNLFGFSTTWTLYDSNNKVKETNIPDIKVKEYSALNKVPIILNDRGYECEFIDDETGEVCHFLKKRINMYNKLYAYVKTKVSENEVNNSKMYDQRAIFGDDLVNVINYFVKKILIADTMMKYKFNEVWDKTTKSYKENIVGFNKTVVKYQLMYYLKAQYIKNPSEITSTKNSEGLSSVDKFLMNQNKIDEGSVILSEINIKCTISMIRELIDVPLSEEEIQYYMDNHKPDYIQVQLVYAYYTKFFGSYRDLNLLRFRDYIILLLLLKKKLLIDLGYEEDVDGELHYAALPYIISGNVLDKVNTRIIRNNTFITELFNNSDYNELMNSKYDLLSTINNESIISILSGIINTKFTYVTYEAQDLLGKEINYNVDKVSSELLFLLNSI
jgi:hypothetical protein|nr:MAG TPA: hypothetical protein [Caudoviricetes sp.]